MPSLPSPPRRYIKRWRVECTVATSDGRDFWVRWVSPAGHGYWLHPELNQWIEDWRVWRLPEPMPFFFSAFVARDAILNAPLPPEHKGSQRGIVASPSRPQVWNLKQ